SGPPYAPVVSGPPYPPADVYAPAGPVSGAPLAQSYPYPPADPYPPGQAAAASAPAPGAPIYAPSPPMPVPAQRAASEPTDDFTSATMRDIASRARLEPEPYEAYDPFEPKPVTRTGVMDPLDSDTEPMLPQRVPAEPDVPELVLPPNDPLRDPATATMSEPRQLSRIATFLRDHDAPVPARPPDPL